jgi:hypothetical protein
LKTAPRFFRGVGSNPTPSAIWKMKQLARPLQGLASGFSAEIKAVLSSSRLKGYFFLTESRLCDIITKREGTFMHKPSVQGIAKFAGPLGIPIAELLGK